MNWRTNIFLARISLVLHKSTVIMTIVWRTYTLGVFLLVTRGELSLRSRMALLSRTSIINLINSLASTCTVMSGKLHHILMMGATLMPFQNSRGRTPIDLGFLGLPRKHLFTTRVHRIRIFLLWIQDCLIKRQKGNCLRWKNWKRRPLLRDVAGAAGTMKWASWRPVSMCLYKVRLWALRLKLM